MQYYEEVCFLEQRFVMDDALQIGQLLKSHKPAPLRIASYVRLQCGEGLEETAASDFASEVAQAVQGSA